VSLFDFLSGVLFAPVTLRALADVKLFGTNAAGTGVDGAAAFD